MRCLLFQDLVLGRGMALNRPKNNDSFPRFGERLKPFPDIHDNDFWIVLMIVSACQ